MRKKMQKNAQNVHSGTNKKKFMIVILCTKKPAFMRVNLLRFGVIRYLALKPK